MIYQPDNVETHSPEASTIAVPFRTGLRNFFHQWVKPMVMVILAVTFINLLFPRVYVMGQSMDPSLHDADWLVVSNLQVITGTITRGEIVTLTSPHGEVQAIKRVIGLPGEMVEIEGGVVYINGEPLIEAYIRDLPRYSGRWIVGEDQYFVLGDNRNNSADSADYGPIDASRIHGVAKFRLFPLSQAGAFPVPDYTLMPDE